MTSNMIFLYLFQKENSGCEKQQCFFETSYYFAVFCVQNIVINMREFGNYQIKSDEYRLMYVHQAEQIEELKNKDVRRQFSLQSMQRQIEELKQQLADRDNKIQELESKADIKDKEIYEWKEKFELQDLKTERAHERRLEEEQNSLRLQKVVGRMQKQIGESNCVQILLGSQVKGCRQKIDEQNVLIEQKERYQLSSTRKVKFIHMEFLLPIF